MCLGLCLFALRAPAGAQPAEAWRYWTAADGMRESFVRALTLASDGHIWVRHDAVDALSVLDGYAVTKVPEARKGNIVDWGLLGRVSARKDDEAWLVEDHALRRYAQRQWKIVESEAPGDEMLAAAPAGLDGVRCSFAIGSPIINPKPAAGPA